MQSFGVEWIGNVLWLSFSMICRMIPLSRLQKLLVAPSTAERLKDQQDVMLTQASGNLGHESRLSWVLVHLHRCTVLS